MKGYNTRSVWIISAEIRYLLSEQKKFQNKSKNIDEVYQSVFFRCIMFLSYKVTFLCNVLGQIHYTSRKSCTIFFYEKVVKWLLDNKSIWNNEKRNRKYLRRIVMTRKISGQDR